MVVMVYSRVSVQDDQEDVGVTSSAVACGAGWQVHRGAECHHHDRLARHGQPSAG